MVDRRPEGVGVLFVPAEVVPWWVGLAVAPAVARWRHWRVTRLLTGGAMAAAGVAYYRSVMAHRPAGYYALFEAWAGIGLVLAGGVVSIAGVVRLCHPARIADAEPITAADGGAGLVSEP